MSSHLPLGADPDLDLDGLYRDLEIDPTEADALVDRLLSRPAQARLQVANCPRLRNKTVLDRLMERAREKMSSDLPCALERALLARILCTRTLRDGAERRLVRDCQVLAHSLVAHVYRRLFKLRRSSGALRRAEGRISGYSGNPLVAAELLTARALYLADSRKPDEALELLEGVLSLYQATGRRQCFGETLLYQAGVLGNAGQPEEAIDKASRARSYLDLAGRWGFVLLQNLAQFHAETGDLEEAHDYLSDALSMPHYSALPHDRLRVAWVRARLLALEDKPKEAQAAFATLRQAFIEEGLPYEAALSSLDLASELARDGQMRLLRPLAAEVIDFFRGAGLPREAESALRLLRWANTTDAIEDIVRKIRILQARRPVSRNVA